MSSYLPIYSFAFISLISAAGLMVARDLLANRRRTRDSRLGMPLDDRQLIRLEQALPDAPPKGIAGRIDYRFASLIAETGIEAPPEAAFLAAVTGGLLVGGGLFLGMDDLLAGICGMVVGMGAVIGYFFIRRARRRTKIREQLPDVMDLMARAVRAGESIDQAFSLIGETSYDPLSVEFRRCAQQLEMGLSMPATLRALTRRAPIVEMRILAAALVVQRYAGGNLPITLERLSRVIRDRLSYYRSFRAATAAGRASTILIGLAGPLVAIYLLIWQREYIATFLETTQGQSLLATAIVLQILGLAWIAGILRNNY